MLKITSLIFFGCLWISNSFAKGSLSRQDFENIGASYLSKYVEQWDNRDLGFMTTAKALDIYFIGNYHNISFSPSRVDHSAGPAIIAVYEGEDPLAREIHFGILFSLKGDPIRILDLEKSESEPCIPYFISEPGWYQIRYTPESTGENLLLQETRMRVLTAVEEEFERKTLLTGRETIRMGLAPNDSPYDSQESMTLVRGLKFRANALAQAIEGIELDGVLRLHLSTERAGQAIKGTAENPLVCRQI